MPLQSSGIIVVDKASVIAATGTTTVTTTTAINSPCKPNPPRNLGGGGAIIGPHPIHYHKQQSNNFQEWNENDAAASIQQSISAISNINSNLMRRHQRTISSSSTASSSSTSSQNTKALTLANQNFNQMNQINQQQHHQQQQQQSHLHQQHHHTVLQATATSHSNQVIVSEDFIEHAGFNSPANVANATATNVINLAANDLINQTQIIKLVSDGNGGNVLIDSLGNVTNGSHHHGNSKLLVGNLTVLSKQSTSAAGQQQQTINFVNAKNLPYLTTTKNQTQPTAVQKIVNIPLKTANSLVKTSGSSQLHHHHISNTPNGGPIMQKVTMPRSLHVVTRVQGLAPSSPQHHQQQSRQQQIQQQTNVLINQMIVQEKDMHGIVNSPAKINNTNGGNLKKQNLNPQMKVTQQQKLNSQCATQGVKAIVHQHQHQQQQFQTISTQQVPTVKQVKSQKLVRQFSNGNNNSPVSLTMQHQQHQRPSINVTGTYTINNGKINNIPVQQQNPGVTTKIIGGNAVKNSPTALGANTKYLMQNHIVLPPVSTNAAPSTNQGINNKIGNNNTGVANNIVVQQQIINTINSSVCGNINASNPTGSGTIKFVNAHGAVVQSQQHQQSPTLHQPIQQQHQKVRSNNLHHHHPHQQQTIHISPQQHHQQHHHLQQQNNQAQFIDGGKAVSIDNSSIYLSTIVSNNATNGMGTVNGQNPSTEDIMIVNGTQMTDEISARILQSMSQKSVYNSNQRQHQHQSKMIAPPPPIASPQTNIILSSPIPREYPIYNPVHNVQLQHSRQTASNPASRSQSLERKYIDPQSSSIKRSSSEFFKVNTYEIQTTHSTTFIDNIPLPCPLERGDNAPAAQQAEHEDDIIGEEVRPVPVSTHDARLQALHAVLQDHTYVAPMPTRLPLDLQSSATIGGINIGGSSSSGVYTSGGCIMGQNSGNSTTTIGGITQNQSSTASLGSSISGGVTSTVGFPFGQSIHRQQQQHDDDANSVISNESRAGPGLDNDLGEETETAPEAEAEDDSVTRCICDLTHDDGYMICCDKCSAWQHVDCMGIDRQNIPDEYLCEICQPRQVDRVRARNLQLIKRKEQTQHAMNAQLNAAGSAGVSMTTDANGQLVPNNQQSDRTQLLSVNTSHVNPVIGKKGKILTNKKRDIIKKNKKDRANGKRRESKRTAKRKSKSSLSTNETAQVDKYASNLRQWIENYEVAMTNHYSPELRARLHAISKQQNLLQHITATENKILKNCGSLENRCTTVPHAGGKILISNLDIQPNSPIVELRGKYMLTTQYKTQNPNVNMNAPPTNCLQQNVKNQKTPGPFIFFYKLSMDGSVGPEICVDTRTYGNEARFVRRSCRPNAEIQHSFEKGTIHLYLVSLTNIMASTEITIRHEPHDLIALENKNFNFSIAPTSTICACGLTKDCAFGGSQLMNIKANRKIAMNGCVNDGKIMSGKKNSQNVGRGRSTSSSGESNAGLLSPNNNNNFTPSLYSSASISNLTHDSGVYTSSSSPSVSIPSPTHTQAINSPPQQGHPALLVQTQEPIISTTSVPIAQVSTGVVLPAKSPQKVAVSTRKTVAKQTRHSTSEDNSQSSTGASQPQTEEKRESRKLTREERKMEAIVRAFEKMEKTQLRKQELKQARTSSAGSAASKRRNSSSPSPKRMKTQSMSESGGEATVSIVNQSGTRKNPTPTVTRKKKRKGSKSYHSQNNTQRKRRRSRVNSNDSDILTSEESTSLLSPPIPSGSSCAPPAVPPQQECADRQMTLMVDLIESQIAAPNDTNMNQAAGLLLALSNNEKSEQIREVSSGDHRNAIEQDILESPVRTPQGIPETTTPQTSQTAPVVSSTCLLVEAAVGPLESFEGLSSNDFKLPTKAKTKKSIMNDWLNQSNDYQHEIHQSNVEEDVHIEQELQAQSPTPQQQCEISQQFQAKNLDTLVQAAATICDYRRTASSPAAFMASQTYDEPQNLSIVAKKVEEFIHQNDANFICSEDTIVKYESPLEHLNSLTLPLQSLNSSTNCSGSSSVKKRWLRQAISEETDEIAAAALSACSPTQVGQIPNGFTTPLKKRRVVRQCNDEEQGNNNPEDLSLSKSGSDCSIGNDDGSTSMKIEILDDEEKSQMKQEIVEAEDEVDIITSPPPNEKIVIDDNLVKIEPEDVSKEIKIDVEREESCSSEVAKKVEVSVSEIKADVEETKFSPSPKQEIEETEEKWKNELQVEKEIKVEASLPLLVINNTHTTTEPITPVKDEQDNYESVSDEIADIQKRLLSFHKENIEMLQSRNRKSKIARSLKLGIQRREHETTENKSNAVKHEKTELGTYKVEDVRNSRKDDLSRHRSSKKRHLNFDSVEKEEREYKHRGDGKKRNHDSKYEERKISEDFSKEAKLKHEDLRLKGEDVRLKNDMRFKSETKIKEEKQKIDEKQLQAALTIPAFNHNLVAPNSAPNTISGYVVNTPILSNQSYDISSLLLAPPPPPPLTPPPSSVQTILPVSHISNTLVPIVQQPPPLHLPYYNTIYGKLMDKGMSSSANCLGPSPSLSSSNLLLSDYLDTKAKSYSTLGGYVSHSTLLFGLNNSKSNTGHLGNSTSVSVPNTLDSNLSSQTSSKTCGKIITKTASADPRLNPILTAPEPPPAPKRKLSINEYRKRKQLFSESSNVGTTSQSESESKSTSNTATNSAVSTRGTSENGDVTDLKPGSEDDNTKNIAEAATKVQFSPAPTLLEKQQEILCERRKTLKNKNSSGAGCSLGVSSLSSIMSGNLSSSDRFSSMSSSTSNLLSSQINVNNLSISKSLKGDLELSKRLSASTTSLESISSSSSPISSKESTPERTISPQSQHVDERSTEKTEDDHTNLKSNISLQDIEVKSENGMDVKVSR